MHTCVHSHNYTPAVCDPVLGDEGRLYVPREMISEYRDQILPLASVIVPNQTEVCEAVGKGDC